MYLDSQVDARASFRREFDAICELGRSASDAVPEDASRVLSSALQNLNAITERNSAVAAKAEALKPVQVVEETAAVSLAGWTLEKGDMVCERNESPEAVNVSTLTLWSLPNKSLAK